MENGPRHSGNDVSHDFEIGFVGFQIMMMMVILIGNVKVLASKCGELLEIPFLFLLSRG